MTNQLCACGHADDVHDTNAPYGCRLISCECPSYKEPWCACGHVANIHMDNSGQCTSQACRHGSDVPCQEYRPVALVVAPTDDPVKHPSHYAPRAGVECIAIAETFEFNLGNVVKYVWRADAKNGLEDLQKAAEYIRFEIERRQRDGG